MIPLSSMDYAELVEIWKASKHDELSAQTRRNKVEREIYKRVKDRVKESGTNHLWGGITITTGKQTKLVANSQQVDSAYAEFVKLHLPLRFPFKRAWEVDSSALKQWLENDLNHYTKLFADLVEVKDKRPSFSLRKEKE